MADDKSIADRLANEKAARDAARVATEKEAERIYAARVRDQRVANPVTGNVARTVLPTPPDFSYNTRSMSPLAPVDLDNRYIRTPGLVSNRGPSYIPPNPSQQPRQDRPVGPTTLPPFLSNSSNRIPTASDISLPTMGKKKSAITDPKNFFALDPSKPASLPGLLPGTVSLAPLDLPIAAGKKTLEAIAANPNLSPKMLGGQENAGIMIDRLGNRIYSPGAGPLLYRSGGEVSNDINTLLAQNTSTLSDEEPEEAINTNPVGTAQKYLADLSSAGKASPTRLSVKRTKTPTGGGATADKAMQMAQEDLAKGDLGSMKDRAPAAKNTESARSQMEEIARVYQLKIKAAQNAARGLSAATFGAPTLEQPTLTKGKLTKKRFAEGGEAKKSDAEEAEALARLRKLPPTIDRAGGSPKEGEVDALEGMQKKARENEMYRASEKYLQSRDQIPDIELERLGLKEGAVFSSLNLPIGSGTITLNKDDIDRDSSRTLGEALLAHEITHAADRQMKQQAIEQRGKGTKFAEAYEKLMGPEGRNRASLARRLNPEWESENRSYRSKPEEIAAYGVGAFSTPVPKYMTPLRAPLHVDSTAATEFQILLDLAQRDIDKGPKGIERVPRFLRKFFKYADGGPVYRAKGSPEEGELTQDEIDAASKPAFVTPKSGKGRQEGPISQALNSGEAYVNVAKGLTEMPYNLAGAPMDLVMLARQGLTGQAPAGQVGTSDYIKNKMTELGIRQAPPTDPTAKGFYTAGDLLSNLTNPAAVPRKVGPAIERGVKAGATEVGRQLDRAIMDNAGPLAKAVPDAARPMYAVPPQSRAVTPAPASNLGFYSAAEQAALNLPRKEGSGAAFLNDLMKAPDVKKEELASMGLDEFLKSKPKATREEVQDFIANNRLDVKEVQFGNLRDQAEKKQQEAAGKLVNLINAQDGASIRLEGTQGKVFSDEALYALQDGTTAPSQFPLEFQGAANGYLKAYEAAKNASNTKTKFDPYQLPGGENYREILLTLPTRRKDELDAAQVAAGDLRRQTADLMEQWKSASELNPGTPETVALYQKVAESRKLRDQAEAAAQDLKDQFKSQTYKSSHFAEPNILAHMRVNDRVDADGKKMLLIEELQSDWHQAGRDKGYKGDMPAVDYNDPAYVAARDRARELLNEFNANNTNRAREDEIFPLLEDAREAEQQFVRASNKRRAAVPDAPFKDTWHQLALKRALKYAADNGYDRVGLTTGRQQVERYTNEMRQNVDEIVFEKSAVNFPVKLDTPNIQITASKNGKETFSGSVSREKFIDGPAQGKTVEEVLGKSMAKQIAEHKQDVGSIKGDDLTIGGEGMKKYYDEIYPAFLAKQAKKYGAQVGETRLERTASKDDLAAQVYGRGETYKNLPSEGKRQIDRMYMGSNVSIRYIDIAPKMKSVVPYAKGGAVDKNRAFIKAHS